MIGMRPRGFCITAVGRMCVSEIWMCVSEMGWIAEAIGECPQTGWVSRCIRVERSTALSDDGYRLGSPALQRRQFTINLCDYGLGKFDWYLFVLILRVRSQLAAYLAGRAGQV